MAPYDFLSAERSERTADSDQIGKPTGCHTSFVHSARQEIRMAWSRARLLPERRTYRDQ
ncbi:protein of unknown function [Streptomyces sp. KY75]|nr:protein of unknown function [Streptomyces sp. KY70]CAD5987955.1 protein of unknown function [Streptomyces sp. KY75]